MSALADRYAQVFEEVAELVGHRLVLEHKRPGGHDRYRASCSCGYSTAWGKSFRYHAAAAVGHLGRVSKDLDPYSASVVGVSLRQMISGAA